jgi:GGDEF domain-containing protein
MADELVRSIGQALRQKARRDDQLGRFDGSRFLVLLRRVDSELSSLIVAQIVARLRAVCERHTGSLDSSKEIAARPSQERALHPIGIRCGVVASESSRPGIRSLVSGSLAQWKRARIAGQPVSFGLALPCDATSEKLETCAAGGTAVVSHEN